jgi:hypothetical protein
MSSDLIGLTLTIASMAGVLIFLYALVWRKQESSYDEPDWWRKTWNAVEPDPAPSAPAGLTEKRAK